MAICRSISGCFEHPKAVVVSVSSQSCSHYPTPQIYYSAGLRNSSLGTLTEDLVDGGVGG